MTVFAGYAPAILRTGVCDLVPTNNGIACDDNSACTAAETCKNGACAGVAKSCDDGFSCTKDSCTAKTGCLYVVDNTACDDDNPCTNDTCQIGKGCVHVITDGKCDDGDVCTSSEQCDKAGKCVGVAKVCDDKDPCTADTCDKIKGCASAPSTRYGVLEYDAGWEAVAAGAYDIAGDVVWGGVGRGSKTAKWALWLRRQTADGKLVWHKDVTTGTTLVGGDVLGLSGGRGIISAATDSKPGGFVAAVDAGGQVQWKRVVGVISKDGPADGGTAEHLARLPGDDVGFGGDRLIGRISGAGTVLWQRVLQDKLAGLGDGELAVRALASTGNDLLAGGIAGASKVGGSGAFVARFDSDGNPLWATSPLGALPTQAVVQTGVGLLVASGAQVAVTDSKGIKKAQLTMTGIAADGIVVASNAAVDGGLVLVYRRPSDTKETRMVAIDGNGQTVWARKLGLSAALVQRTNLTRLGGGDLLLTGTVIASNRTAARAWRLDPWAYDACQAAGDCADKTTADCADSNVCTNDSCIATLGCHHAVNTLPCDDGDVCSEGDTCAQTKCKPKGIAGSACDDGNHCTNDACDLAQGCTHTNAPGTCDDGDLCTAGDVCALGLCKPGKTVDCDDGNACTNESCAAKTGCAKTFNADPCQAGTCTFDDKCTAGFCKASGKSAFLSGWYGTNKAEHPGGIDRVDQDGFIAVGRTHQNTDPDGYVTRVGADGKVAWSHIIKPPYGAYGGISGNSKSTTNDSLQDVLRVPGGFVAVGYTNLCYDRIWVLRLDDAGKTVWNKLVNSGSICNGGTTHATRAFAIAPGHDGTWAIAGDERSYPHAWNNYDGYVARINDAGNRVDHVNLGGSPGHMRAIASVPGGGYFVAGYAYHTGQKHWNGWIVRLSGGLDVVWSVGFDRSSGNDHLFGVAPAADGGAFAVGSSTGASKGGADGMVLRVSALGKVVWSRPYGGEAHDYFYDIVVEAGDRLVIGGTTFSKGAGGGDAWLIGSTEKVATAFERTYGSAQPDTLTALVSLVHGGYALLGEGTQKGGVEPDLRVQLVDAFGHDSCSAAGICEAKTGPDCDDGVACTADSCDASKGCTHVPINGCK